MTDPQQGPTPPPEHQPVFPPAQPVAGPQYPAQPMPWVPPMAPVRTAQTQSLSGPPGVVRGAFWLWLAGIVISVLANVVGLFLPDTTMAWLAGDAALVVVDVADSSREQVVTLVVGLVFSALFAFFGFQMQAGRNWARIVLTVLVALNLIDAAVTPLARGVTSWVGLATDLGVALLMYLGPANAYFRYMKYV